MSRGLFWLAFLFCLSDCAYMAIPETAHLAGLSSIQQKDEIRAARLIIESRELMVVREWENTEQKLKEAKKIRSELFNEPDLALQEVDMELGKLYQYSGQISRAVSCFYSVGQRLLIEQYDDVLLQSKFALELGLIFQDLGFTQYSEQLIKISEELRSKSLGENDLLTKIAKYWHVYITGKLQEMPDSYFKNLIDSIETNYKKYELNGDMEVAFGSDDYLLFKTKNHAYRQLAQILWTQGRKSSLQFLLNSLEIRAQSMRTATSSSSASATLLSMIGDIYLYIGELNKAHRSYERALDELDLHERQMIIYSREGFDDEARIKNIRLDFLKIIRVMVLKNLARWALEAEDYSKSEQYLRWAITEHFSIRQGMINNKNEIYEIFGLLGRLGTTYWRQGKTELALSALYDALDIFEERFRSISDAQGEALLLNQMEAARGLSDEILNLLDRPENANSTDIAAVAMASVFLSQGRVADEIAAQNLSASNSQSTPIVVLHQRLSNLQIRLSSLELSASQYKNSSKYWQEKQKIEEEMMRIKQQINQITTSKVQTRSLPWSREIIHEISSRIPDDKILINYVSYIHREHDSSNRNKFQRNYLAFLMTRESAVRVVNLGDVRSIDECANKLRKAIIHEQKKYGDYEGSARDLYKKIIQPLWPWIDKYQEFIIVSDGQLNIIPFDVLHDGKKLLFESKRMFYLSSGRDLLWQSHPSPSTDIVVFANPDLYVMPGDMKYELLSEPREPNQQLRTMELTRTPLGIRAEGYGSLPGAELEATDIAQLYPDAKLHFWIDASEQRLFHLRAPPGVLHISAHGVFTQAESSDFSDHTRRPLSVEFEPPPLNPLLRSMVLLAGARRGRQRSDSLYDGIATALEISTLSFYGTQMVVLSTCESGLGDILPGEGVAGLRRAFFVAGAETVVASLWTVNDPVTRELMRRFYRHLRDGVGRAQAMHDAAAEIRRTNPHPYYWASFLVIGQDGPLRGMENSVSTGEEATILQAAIH